MPTGTVSLTTAGGRSAPMTGDFSEAAAAETVAEASVSLALEATTLSPHYTYSATAEDAGVVGALDASPGVTFSGPMVTAVRVSFSGLVLSEGTIAPEATDSLSVGVFKNSVLQSTATNETVSGEQVVTELDAFAATMQIDTIIDAVAPGDVIRFGIIGLGEETVDIDVAVGGAVSIG